MKQTFITLVLALAFAAGAAAQSADTTAVSDSGRTPSVLLKYTSAIVQASPSFSHPVVRNINLTYSLAAGKSGNSVYFYLINHNDFANTFLPPPNAPYITAKYVSYTYSSGNVFVKDMCIVNNYAFFCGYIVESSGQSAIWGYFDYTPLFSGFAPTVYTTKLKSSSTTTAPISLDKLVAYQNASGYYDIVAIGDETTDHYYCKTKIVEIKYITGILSVSVATVPNYAPTPAYYSGKVFLDDVVLTGNNVVVMGRDWNVISHTGTSYPCFFIGAKGSVVSDICSPTPNRNRYLNSSWDANDTIAGVALNDGRFAMAHVFYNDPTQEYYTRLRVIDPTITPILNTNSQQFLKNDKEDPVEMAYFQNPHRIELLQPIANPSNFIQLLPYATSSYTAQMLNPDGNVYESLCRIGTSNTDNRFISVHPGGLYLEDRSASLPHSNPSCPANANKSVALIGNVAVLQIPYTITSGTLILYSIPSPTPNKPQQMTITNQCYSYENQ